MMKDILRRKMRMKTRHTQCLEALGDSQMTAREVSEYMHKRGYTVIRERNIAHPRLNELVKAGLVRIVGSSFDAHTKKEVSVYEKVTAI
jgi:repressor of nif and glnA expression